MMLPVPRLKGQPQLWQLTGEPPPWVWMIPTTSGFCRIATAAPAAPPPVLISSPPPLLQAVSGWQLACDPFLPLMRVPAAAEPTISHFSIPNVQWELPSRPHVLGLPHSAGVELLPVFPPVYRSALPPHLAKTWLEKRASDYKVLLNNALALETAWAGPEEVSLLQRQDKPLLLTNQMALSISRSTSGSAPRNLNSLLVTPRRISGCPVAIRRVGSNKRIALAAAAMMAVESENSQGLSSSSSSSSSSFSPSSSAASSIHPLHLLSLSPIRIPLFSPPAPGVRGGSWGGWLGPLLPAQLARVASLAAPGMTLIPGPWREHTPTDKRLTRRRASCGGALVLRTEHRADDRKEECLQVSEDGGSGSKDKRPVASTPVPGSPWCVVWTGDDRVFFFNPTMQLSVWDKPVDLQDRGDLNRIIEDPPHKRKKDSLSRDCSSSLSADDEDDEDDEEHSSKIKRNKLEEPCACTEGLEETGDQKGDGTSSHQTVLPLELRITHFRDMLLERGVSAFSTWEKELHKIVFDPRYLLLSSEERKQVFDQFVKARMKEEYREKKCKLLQAKEEFRKLLEETKINTRSTFKEFSEKHGRDQRFRQVQKKKDQELFFNQFISALRKRDKENRLRLRKMR